MEEGELLLYFLSVLFFFRYPNDMEKTGKFVMFNNNLLYRHHNNIVEIMGRCWETTFYLGVRYSDFS